ncbi:MAG TPA: flagellar filament capping protein FliD [Actinoplanes sp.]|nr:flagellar filament capping protein FliD [Actinoplanes sp.]
MASVDGLITGMSTTDTINQLMKLEAAPQTALKSKITTANKVVNAYQSVNTKLAAIATAARDLGNPDAWGAMKATSSSDAAAVTAGTGATGGELSFRVRQLAATHTVTYTGTTVASPSDAVLSDSTFTIAVPDGDGTKLVDLTPASPSLKDVVAAINGSTEAPYTAAAVRIGDGQYTLQLTAKESGKTAGIAMENLGGPLGLTLTDPAVTVPGDDAILTVGSAGSGYQITSKTNTFADVLSGVTVTATRAQAETDVPVTIKLSTDAEGITAKVQTLVDNVNAALSEIATQSKPKAGAAPAGPLAGDSAMRSLAQELLSAVSSGVDGLGTFGTASLSDIGIGVGRDGKLTFNKDDFTKAFRADPAQTAEYLTKFDHTPGGNAGTFEPGFDRAQGMARKLSAIALIATEGVVDPTNPTRPKQGTLQGLIQQRNDAIRGLNDQVAAWDVRLESRKTALQRQFANLEVALGKMQQQSSWLAGQLAGLA